ncbi:MAG: 4-hydroxy-tetrahydrodipicolinate synthase [Bacillota bacterium]|nr:4-hydroxy-tetrahydrodipicolinate synthase [Bacillota bacterium]
MKNTFGCLITAMATPFDQSFRVDYDKVAELAELLLEKGSDSLVVTGTTGESPTLSDEEKFNIYKTVVNTVKGRAIVIAGTGGNSTQKSVEMSRKAEEIGVDGLMLVTPYYNKPPQEGLYHHFKNIADAVSLPIMLYNVPGRTVINLSVETTLKLAVIDNIVSIKEASGNLEQITYICEAAPDGFDVYSGDDSMTLPILSIGGKGVVSVASHLVGPEIKKMITSFLDGDITESRSIHQKLMPLFKALFMTTSPIPLKAALQMTGMEVGSPRLPLMPLPENMKIELKNVLQKYRLV